MNGQKFLVQLVNPNAKYPIRGSVGAAGYDLFSSENVTIPVSGRYAVDTGLIMKIPDNCYGRVAARSGLAVKHSIDVSAGVIDSDYRGIVKILLLNNGKTPFEIRIGDRIAQLILENISTPEISPAEDLAATEKTERGAGGFGSTGGFAGQ